MNIIECTNTANTTAKKNREIKYIVIHYTAGTTSKPGTAKSTAKYFAKETTKASADFIVDDENIVQYNPDIKNRYTWHCGGSKYKTKGGSLYKICTSANSIGIEMCSTNHLKKVTAANDENWDFTEAVINNTVELVKKLCLEYDVSPYNVIRHYDVNGKPCPGVVGWNEDTNDISEWEDFKSKLFPPPEIIEEAEEIVEPGPEPVIEEKAVEVKVPQVSEKQEVKQEQAKKQGFFELLLSFLHLYLKNK